MPNLTASTVSPEDARRELAAVLRSPTFERSERLQKFLQYVCELTLQGEGAKINEYLIGNEVFQRGPSYSPNEDSVVRRQAHALRRKLQEHYEREGRDSEIRIELPVGRYVPIFRRRDEFAQVPVVELAPPVETPPPKPKPVQVWWAVAAAGAAVLFFAGWLVGRATPAAPKTPRLDPAVAEIWGDWLKDPQGVSIGFSNPLTAVIKHFAVPVPADSLPKRVPLTAEQGKLTRAEFGLPEGGYLYFAPAVSQSKTGEAIGAVALAALFAASGVPVRTTQSRFLNWEDLRKHNLILMGHDEANRWIDPLLAKYPFRLSATSGARQRAIVNTKPEAGEQPEYQIKYAAEAAADATQEYVLISVLPGVDGRHKLMLISGLNTQATQSAVEFLTDPVLLRQLLSAMQKRAPTHRGQWQFQAILSTEVHDKVPTKATLVALRVL